MWHKQGLIYGPDYRMKWATNSALTPTPVVLGDRIRVFAGFRDDHGTSRIGYVDVRSDDPATIIAVSPEPVLDIGQPGTFDDAGVILGDVVPDGTSQDGWRMYYVGFQHVARAKFFAFTGLARAGAECTRFKRVSQTPVLDRADEGLFIRAIHTAHFENGAWRIWYAAGRRWQQIAGKDFPTYEIRTSVSPTGTEFPATGDLCLEPAGREYRIGRPRVLRSDQGYEMLFTKGTLEGDYTPGWAASSDGRHWTRNDANVDLPLSTTGWDSQTVCYPVPVEVGGRRFMFYNGNNMGRAGFGYAEWIE